MSTRSRLAAGLLLAAQALGAHASAPAPSPLARRAATAYAEGRYARSAELYGAAIRRAPGQAQLHALLACAHFAAGERRAAALAAAAASALEREPLSAWRERLRTYLEAGARREALVAAIEIDRLRAPSCEAALLVVVLAGEVDGAGAAESAAWRAFARCPAHAPLVADLAQRLRTRGCAGDALALLEGARWAADDPRVIEVTAGARADIAARYDAADRRLARLEQEVARRAVAPAPSGSPPDVDLGAVLDAIRGAADAAEDPESELRRAEAYRLGHALAVEGALARALDHARRAITGRPSWARARLLLGALELLRTPVDARAAERSFEEAIALDAEGTLSAAHSGLFFAAVARRDFARAMAAANAYLAREPGDADFRTLAGEVRDELAR